MDTSNVSINFSLNFNQVVDIIKQLPHNEKLKLSNVLIKETKHTLKDFGAENDKVLTHFASENVLAKDWLLSEEDEAWKDL